MEDTITTTKPNLFDFATSELSQDAVLAWLLQWADPVNQIFNPKLHKTGKFFIQKLFEQVENHDQTWKELPIITAVEIDSQRYKIDLLIWLKCADNIPRAILIEDKVYSNTRHRQLDDYLKKIVDTHLPREQVLPVFLKTGYQPDWEEAKLAGYIKFTALDLQEVWAFGENEGVQNDVFCDFGRYLKTLSGNFKSNEESFKNFDQFKVADWNEWHWIGFFKSMKNVLSYTGFANNQFKRDRLLSFWFGYIPLDFTFEGRNIQCGPNFDIAISNGVPILTIRMWVQDLTKQGVHFKDYRAIILQKLTALNLGVPGRYKDANDTILLMKLKTDFDDMTANQLAEFLQSLQTQLQSISTSDGPK